MKSRNWSLATLQVLLVAPALVFMVALFLREVQPLAQTGRLVAWFSQHVVVGLYVFLVLMPLAALVTGGAVVLRSWYVDAEFRRAALDAWLRMRGYVAQLIMASATLVAGAILVLVALHMITE